jgi:hypothetical protein
MVTEDIITDMNRAREVLLNTGCSVVVVKENTILAQKKGDGIKPMLKVIKELEQDLKGAVIGDKILGKASALLCVYSSVSGVYSLQATKTAIAVLIRAGIPGQTDEMIPYITNKSGNDMCPFEKVLLNIDFPDEAYQILKKIVSERDYKK